MKREYDTFYMMSILMDIRYIKSLMIKVHEGF